MVSLLPLEMALLPWTHNKSIIPIIYTQNHLLGYSIVTEFRGVSGSAGSR